MKKWDILCILALCISLILTGCSNASSEIPASDGISQTVDLSSGELPSGLEQEEIIWDTIPMVMVNGKLYYDTGEESTVDGRCGTPDGEITSTVDGSEVPEEDNQSNFGTGFTYQYGSDDTLEIFMNDKWVIFEHREGDGSQVRFGDKMVDASGLSQETLEWLTWYNDLSEEEQLEVSSIPEDLAHNLELTETSEKDTTVEEATTEICVYPTAENLLG